MKVVKHIFWQMVFAYHAKMATRHLEKANSFLQEDGAMLPNSNWARHTHRASAHVDRCYEIVTQKL